MYKRILIIQTAFPGDVILTLPVLQVLKKNYPESMIDFLCIPQTKELLENNPNVNEVIAYDKKKSGTKELFELIGILKEKKYDLILSPHRSFRSAMISKLSSAGKTISFDKSSMSFLYDEKIKYEQNIHEIQRNLKLLEPLGIKEDIIVKPELFIDEKQKNKVDAFLKENETCSTQKIICIAPGTVWFTKRFPKEKFVRVCDLLIESDYKIILIGGEADRDLCTYILENTQNKNVTDASGKFSLTESAELIRRSERLITNDSAPLHLANSVETPVTAIFGATIPGFGFYPSGSKDVVVETLGLTCRPCSIHGSDKCPIGTFVCMWNIKEEKIVNPILLKTD